MLHNQLQQKLQLSSVSIKDMSPCPSSLSSHEAAAPSVGAWPTFERKRLCDRHKESARRWEFLCGQICKGKLCPQSKVTNGEEKARGYFCSFARVEIKVAPLQAANSRRLIIQTPGWSYQAVCDAAVPFPWLIWIGWCNIDHILICFICDSSKLDVW